MSKFFAPHESEKMNGTSKTHGLEVSVEVSPCSWLSAGYGFQFGYKTADGHSHGFCHDKAIDIKDAKPEDIQRLLDTTLKPEPCKTCGHTHLFNPTSNRKHECEKCFVGKINAKIADYEKQAAEKLKKQDTRLKKKGFRFRVTAWIHPKAGGDDRMVDYYYPTKPTKTVIQTALKDAGSAILDDYQIVEL